MTDVHINWLGARLQSQQERIELLVAEVQRLRREVHPALVAHKARIEELEAALHALVEGDPIAESDMAGEYCFFCNSERRQYDAAKGHSVPEHAPDCPWVVARALLKSGEG